MQLTEIFQPVFGLIAGGAIGWVFGVIQNAAARRYAKKQDEGKFNSAWAATPGSMTRVACLLIALALVQAICPMLFVDGTQWWVSTGVVIAYGLQLFRNFRERRLRAA